MAAYCTVPHGAPPPKWMRLKWVSSRIPRLRMRSFSGLVSMVKVESPLTSCGATPASSRAAMHASSARRSSLRPELLENSVAPMPAMAVRPANPWLVTRARYPSPSADPQPGVDVELHAGDAGAAGRGEEQHRLGHVVGRRDPPEHGLAGGVGEHLLD